MINSFFVKQFQTGFNILYIGQLDYSTDLLTKHGHINKTSILCFQIAAECSSVKWTDQLESLCCGRQYSSEVFFRALPQKGKKNKTQNVIHHHPKMCMSLRESNGQHSHVRKRSSRKVNTQQVILPGHIKRCFRTQQSKLAADLC